MVNLHADDPAEIERARLSKERWMGYQKQLNDLGLYGVMKGKGAVEFRVETGSFYNGDSYKGSSIFPFHRIASERVLMVTEYPQGIRTNSETGLFTNCSKESGTCIYS